MSDKVCIESEDCQIVGENLSNVNSSFESILESQIEVCDNFVDENMFEHLVEDCDDGDITLGLYGCLTCKEMFFTRKSLIEHSAVHNPTSEVKLELLSYQCKDCPETFNDEQSKNEHELTHEITKPEEKIQIIVKSGLTILEQVNLDENLVSCDEDIDESYSNDETSVSCVADDQISTILTFSSQNLLVEEQLDLDASLSCDSIMDGFISSEIDFNLSTEIELQEEPNVVPEIPLVITNVTSISQPNKNDSKKRKNPFSREAYVKVKKRKKSVNTEIYTCSVCNACFARHCNMKRHYKEVHELKKNFPCLICNRVISSRDRFNAHMKHVHHVKTHRTPKSPVKIDKGHPNYTCLPCNKTFTKQKRFRKHLNLKHIKDESSENENSPKKVINDNSQSSEGNDKRSYTCSWCNRNFLKYKRFVKHVNGKRCYMDSLCSDGSTKGMKRSSPSDANTKARKNSESSDDETEGMRITINAKARKSFVKSDDNPKRRKSSSPSDANTKARNNSESSDDETEGMKITSNAKARKSFVKSDDNPKRMKSSNPSDAHTKARKNSESSDNETEGMKNTRDSKGRFKATKTLADSNGNPKSTEQRSNYSCPLCNKKFTLFKRFQKHVDSKFCMNGPQCPVCFKRLCTEDYLRSHIKKQHSKGYGSFLNISNNVFKCHICQTHVYKLHKFKQHLKEHSPNNLPKDYRCIPCNKTYLNLANYEKHIKTKCGKTLQTSEMSLKEQSDNAPESDDNSDDKYQNFQSTDSDDKYQNFQSTDSDDHQESDTAQLDDHDSLSYEGSAKKVYECCMCHLKFSDLDNFKLHLQSRHLQALQPTVDLIRLPGTICKAITSGDSDKNSIILQPSPVIEDTSKNQVNVCDVCQWEFTTESELIEHIANRDQQAKHLVCNTCNRKFCYELPFQFHMRLPCRQYQPQHCMGNSLREDSSTRTTEVIKIKFTDQKKRFMCGICKNILKQGELEEHLMTCGSPEKHFKCSLCSLVFDSKERLDLHGRSHCDQESPQLHMLLSSNNPGCSQSMTTNSIPTGNEWSILEQHLSSAPSCSQPSAPVGCNMLPVYARDVFQCPLCPKKFSDRVSHGFHCYNAHGTSSLHVQKSYLCSCGNVFHSVHEFKNHYYSHYKGHMTKDSLNAAHRNLPSVQVVHGYLPNLQNVHGSLPNVQQFHGVLPNQQNVDGTVHDVQQVHGVLPNQQNLHGSLSNLQPTHGSLSNPQHTHGSLSNLQPTHGSVSNLQHAHGSLQAMSNDKSDSFQVHYESKHLSGKFYHCRKCGENLVSKCSFKLHLTSVHKMDPSVADNMEPIDLGIQSNLNIHVKNSGSQLNLPPNYSSPSTAEPYTSFQNRMPYSMQYKRPPALNKSSPGMIHQPPASSFLIVQHQVEQSSNFDPQCDIDLMSLLEEPEEFNAESNSTMSRRIDPHTKISDQPITILPRIEMTLAQSMDDEHSSGAGTKNAEVSTVKVLLEDPMQRENKIYECSASSFQLRNQSAYAKTRDLNKSKPGRSKPAEEVIDVFHVQLTESRKDDIKNIAYKIKKSSPLKDNSNIYAENKFECPICHTKYITRESLKIHLEKVHDLEHYI